MFLLKMREPFYITQSGTVCRRDNTVFFENETVKKVIPINRISSIYCLGEVSINSKLLAFLSKEGVLVHFFNYYGYYVGTFYPKETLVSGSVIVDQVKHYLEPDKRLFLAKSFVQGTFANIVRFL